MTDTMTPSEQIVAANPANTRVTVKTATGKTLKLRRLSVLDQMKVVRAMGPYHSANHLYREIVESAFMVVSVDNEYPAHPTSQEQIDKLVLRLGDDVMESVIAWRTSEISAAMKAAEDALWGEGGKPTDADAADEADAAQE